MKNRSILLFCFVVFMVFIGVVNAQDCSIIGKWQRTDGQDIYTLYEDGTGQALIRWSNPQLYLGTSERSLYAQLDGWARHIFYRYSDHFK